MKRSSSQKSSSSSFSHSYSSKDYDDDKLSACFFFVISATIMLLAIVIMVLALLTLYSPPAPRTAEPNETTTEGTEPAYEDICIGRDHFVAPTRHKSGAETHDGPLPGDVEPLHYAITMRLCGEGLDDAGLNVTGHVEALIRAKVPTGKLVLKASSEHVKDVTMALLDRTGTACHEPRALSIKSVSSDREFLIVKLKNDLEVGKPYTLVTEYRYDTTAANGPIYISPTLGRMDLKPGEAHAAFPCFEEEGWLTAVQLTLVVPENLNAASNTAADGQPIPQGTALAHKFTTTIPMPVDKLAWAAFPRTLIPNDIVPGKVKQYGDLENIQLKESVAKAFLFLSPFFQAPGNEYISKIDFVISASEEQDSLGLVILKPPAVAEGMCRKVAKQWTGHLLLQPRSSSWLATAGVEYLCRLAATEEEDMPAAFQEDLKACMKPDVPATTNELLSFRMAHLITGNDGTKKAIQSYVDKNLFKAASHENELDLFDPHVPKDKLEPWLKGGYEVLDVERTFGKQKKIKWHNAKARPTPFATSVVNASMKLRVPDTPIAVTWLNAAADEAELSIDDTAPLIINPGMMACYGVTMRDTKSWALIGHQMEKELPNPLNAWYFLSQAAKQYENVKRPKDFTGYMWAWAALKRADRPLWDEHIRQFSETEKQAYAMLVTEDEEDAYKKRVLAVIERRLVAIDPSKELVASAVRASTAVQLAELACQLGSDKCTTYTADVSHLIVDEDFQANVEHSTLLSPCSVACHLGSNVEDNATFDTVLVSKTPRNTAQQKQAPLMLRLCFSACVPKGAADDKVRAIAQEALDGQLSPAEAVQVRVSQQLREAVLEQVSELRTLPTQDDFVRVLKNLAILHIVRTSDDLKIVTECARRSSINIPAKDPALKDVVDGVFFHTPPFQAPPTIQAWINDLP